MKEVNGMSANFLASVGEDNTLTPQVEVILLTSEPVYHTSSAGTIDKKRTQFEASRFLATPQNLRTLACSFAELADKAEAIVSKAVVGKATNDAEKPAPQPELPIK